MRETCNFLKFAIRSIADGIIQRRLRALVQGRLTIFPYFTWNKQGLEIGGPSDIFRRSGLIPLYHLVRSLDNCDFAAATVWTSHDTYFVYDETKDPGKTYLLDGSNLSSIPDNRYDFILSCHNLEHFANPAKALAEWSRVLRPRGALILVVPFYRETFDHRRPLTSVEHMLEDFERNTGEDDLTHLPEILALHDLSMTPEAGTLEQFRQRSLSNVSNRCLHHHVFDQTNIRRLLAARGWKVAFINTIASNICILAFSRKEI